jgi:hypothetical protein
MNRSPMKRKFLKNHAIFKPWKALGGKLYEN